MYNPKSPKWQLNVIYFISNRTNKHRYWYSKQCRKLALIINLCLLSTPCNQLLFLLQWDIIFLPLQRKMCTSPNSCYRSLEMMSTLTELISQTGLSLIFIAFRMSHRLISHIIFINLSVQPAMSLEAQWRICSQEHGTWHEWMTNTAGNTPEDLWTMIFQQSQNLFAPALPLRYTMKKTLGWSFFLW